MPKHSKIKSKTSPDLKSRVSDFFTHAPASSVKFNPLLKKLRLRPSEKHSLREVLLELVSDGLLTKNGKYYQLQKPGAHAVTYSGTIVLDEDQDFAVDLETEFGRERIKIRKKFLSTALVNDKVEVSIVEYADRDEKEAVVERIF